MWFVLAASGVFQAGVNPDGAPLAFTTTVFEVAPESDPTASIASTTSNPSGVEFYNKLHGMFGVGIGIEEKEP